MASVAARSVRHVVRWVVAGVLMVSFAGLAGCTHPCLELARKLCECSDSELEREQCVRRADSAFDATDRKALDASSELCAARLESCECADLDTEQGKQACGLSR